MQRKSATCPTCQGEGETAFEFLEFDHEDQGEYEGDYEGEYEGEDEGAYTFQETDGESPYSEAEETELALELLSVASEEELDQFLGKLVKGAWKGIKKVGSAVGKAAGPLGAVLKPLAKAALPWVGGALGTMIPIPGVGTALGRAVGTAVSKALEMEMPGQEMEDQEFEAARRFVRIAGTAAQQMAQNGARQHPAQAVQNAVLTAARRHVPNLQLGQNAGRGGNPNASGNAYANARGGASGRWVRRGNSIVVLTR